MHTLGREMFACGLDVFGGDLHARSALDRAPVVEATPGGDDHGAAADPEIDRLVQPFAAMLEQDVLSRDAQIRCAMLDVGRNIRRSDDDEANVRQVAGDDELARSLGVFSGPDTGGGKKR